MTDTQVCIALTRTQCEALLSMIDTSLKARGLAGAGTAVEIAVIIQSAANSPLPQPEPAPVEE